MPISSLFAGRLSLLALATMCTGIGASADVATLSASKDNTLYEITEGNLSNGAGQYTFVGFTSGFGERRAIMRFDLSSIPTGSTITEVSLRLSVSRSVPGELPIAIHRLIADWGEGASDAGEPGGSGTDAAPGDATWTDRFFGQGAPWATDGGDFAAAASASLSVAGGPTATWSSLATGNAGMLADVQTWHAQPGSNFGWILIASPMSGGARRFDSRENITPTNRPQLTITYTPPASTCIADFNNDQTVGVQDIFDFLGAYFVGDPSADINGGGITVQDIFDFLTAYFAGCP